MQLWIATAAVASPVALAVGTGMYKSLKEQINDLHECIDELRGAVIEERTNHASLRARLDDLIERFNRQDGRFSRLDELPGRLAVFEAHLEAHRGMMAQLREAVNANRLSAGLPPVS